MGESCLELKCKCCKAQIMNSSCSDFITLEVIVVETVIHHDYLNLQNLNLKQSTTITISFAKYVIQLIV